MTSAASPSFSDGLELALGGDDLGAPLALGLGLLRHGAAHLLGQVHLLHLDRASPSRPRARCAGR